MVILGNKNKINCYCYLLFGLFFIIFLTIYSYGVFFLKNLGISYAHIGLIIGISALFASILQPLLGRAVDTHHFSWQKILVFLNIVIIIAVLAMFLLQNVWCSVMFSIMIIVSGVMYPFINYSPFYYENHGVETNFGVARGFGSLSFSIFASVIGFMLTDFNIMIIPLFSLVSAILMIVVIHLLPYYGYESQTKNNTSFKNNVLTKYPIFTLILIAMVLIMTFQNLFECYMINIIENIGGNISDVGISNSLASILELPVMFLFIKILNKISAKNLIILSSFFYIVRSVIIFFAHNPFDIYVAQVLQIVTYALIAPASVHLATEIIDEEDQYEAQAFLGATVTIGLIFANFLGGNILQLYDINILLIVLVALTVLGSIFSFSTLFFKNNS